MEPSKILFGLESELIFEFANKKDISDIAKLVNSAFRGESSYRGWTTEANLLDGQRINAEMLEEDILEPGSGILLSKCRGQVVACLSFKRELDHCYLGMITVEPSMQNQGLGRRLLQKSEELACRWHCSKVRMTVISERDTLIAWYLRQGYFLTGEFLPFPQDEKFGRPHKKLELAILQKNLG